MKKSLFSIMLALILLVSLNSDLLTNAVYDMTAADTAEIESMEDVYFEIEDRDIETGYLLRENFVSFNMGRSGWVESNVPQNTSPSIFAKKTRTEEAYRQKSIVPQSGKLTLEFKIIPIVETTGGYFALRGTKDGKPINAVELKIINDVLYYNDGENLIFIDDIKFGAWNGVKVEADVAECTVNIYFNGICKQQLSGVSMTAAADMIDGLRYGINKDDVGTFRVGLIYIYKGYDIYEDLISAGTGNHFDPDYDYNKIASPRVTAQEHAIPNNNTNIAHLAYDGDDDTYWEHDTNYPADSVSFISEFKGAVVPVDTVKLVFKGNFKGVINVSIQDSAGAWTMWNQEYYWYRFETTSQNEGILIMRSPTPVFVTSFAINFRNSGEDDGYNIPNREIKLATFEIKCTTDLIGYVPSFPSDWDSMVTDSGVEAYQYYGASESRETNVFKITSAAGGQAFVKKDFSRSGSIQADFIVLFEDYADGNMIGLVGNDLIAGIRTNKAQRRLEFIQGTADDLTVTPLVNSKQSFNGFKTNIWYRISLKYNASTNKMSVDINGWSPVEDIAMGAAFANVTWNAFGILSSFDDPTVFYVDNIHVYKLPGQSNVPELERCDTGDIILTMQACTLWREGTHLGWEVLDGQGKYDRKPILGWYDEGSAEVADWEIKMAVDHGINNFMYCWYRDDTGAGPIQSSGLADELWDGIFRSKYRDEISFSLMYTNNDPLPNSYSYEDFVTNLVPYWIEVFFKNPNYLRTKDGKPIFYIYEPSHFITQMGDVNADGEVNYKDAKQVLDLMRNKCIEEGLPGLYIATEYRGAQATVIRNIESCGYDAVFAYTWTSGSYNMSNDEVLSFTKQSMMNQRDAITNPQSFSVIPNISKSWDPRGWTDVGFGGPSPIYMYDLEHYRQLALWTKDIFGGAVIDSKGTKLIMLDNWNEFSEGHWLFPTYGTPAYKNGVDTYGYLDVLREVFGINEYEHRDYLPLEEGFGPYDTWYPKGWQSPANQAGIAVDNSVNTSETIDYALGINTMGGRTEYNAANTVSDGFMVYSQPSAVRLVISSQDIAGAQDARLGVIAELKYGFVSIGAADIATLDPGKTLEIILNRPVDITAQAKVIRTAGGNQWDINNGLVFEFSLKQGGYAVSNLTDTEITIEPGNSSSGYAVIRGGSATKTDLSASTYTMSVSENCSIAFIKNY